MTVPPERFAELQKRRRNMTGRTGCGLCGVDDLTQVARPLPRVGRGVTVDIGAIHQALDALPAWQLANQETGAVHAAAWANPAGEIAFAREDVGRHNALDKLIGAGLRAGLDPAGSFAVMTSRCSFEMVEKGFVTEQDFREFTFTNAARLHTRNNPDFFKGTVVEQAVADELGLKTPLKAR